MNMKFNFKIEMEKWDKFKKEKRFKNSEKRKIIMFYFLRKDRHYTAYELYEEMKKNGINVGYTTVYRTLKNLKESGIADIIEVGDGFLRFEPTHNAHHDHFICEKCGEIIEFYDEDIEKMQLEIAKKYNFKVNSHKLEIFGICEKCRRRQ